HPVVAHDLWRHWWYLNRPTLLDVSYRVAGPGMKPPAPEKWRDDARAVLRDAVESPTAALAAEAALALGRAGDARDLEFLARVASDAHRQPGLRASAVLALGLLPVEAAGPSSEVARATLTGVAEEALGNNDDRRAMWG